MRRLVPALLIAVTALSLAHAPASATITPDAAKVVRRYLEATGGAAAFAAESTSYTHAKLQAFGFEGSFASWSAQPSRRYSRTELGPFKLSEGVNGTTAWRTDPTTGVVRPLADHDLDQALASAWFEGERWAESGEGGGSVALGGHESDSLGTYTVLEVKPPDLSGAGRTVYPRQLWFDDKTGLLAVMRSKDDQREVFTRLSDWRMVAGRKRAIVNESGVVSMPANRVKAVADTLLANVSVQGLPFSPPQAASSSPAPITWLSQAGTAKLPFDYRARHVWLKASVNGGPPEDFLFDTGASVTVIDSAYAARTGLKGVGEMRAQGAGSGGAASLATLDKLRIATPDHDGVELQNLKVAILNVNSVLAPFFWRDCAGVVGFDVIVQFVNQVDYDNHDLYLYDPKTFTYEGKGTAIPMTLAGHAPLVNIKVDDPLIGLSTTTEGALASEDYAGNIGNELLERFRVTLDYERRKIYLEPAARYTKRPSFSLFGAQLARLDGKIKSFQVLKGSPAEKAGLVEGDEVVSIDGTPASQLDPDQLEQKFVDGVAGTKVKLVVVRDGKQKTLNATLKEIL